MWAARLVEGFVFGDLTPAAIETLKGVPMLIESSDARVRDRLLPKTCDDEEDEQQWRQHAVPELERLFLSRAQLVRRDLEHIRTAADGTTKVLLVPEAHVNAWLSALNAARLALYELNDMTPEHMDRDGLATATPKQREAALRIDLLAEIQAVLLGIGEADDDDEESDEDPSSLDDLLDE